MESTAFLSFTEGETELRSYSSTPCSFLSTQAFWLQWTALFLPLLFLTSKNCFHFNNYYRKYFSLWKCSHKAMTNNKLSCRNLFCFALYFKCWYIVIMAVLQEEYSNIIHDNVIILVAYHSFFPSPLISGRRMENLYSSFYDLDLREKENRRIIIYLIKS